MNDALLGGAAALAWFAGVAVVVVTLAYRRASLTWSTLVVVALVAAYWLFGTAPYWWKAVVALPAALLLLLNLASLRVGLRLFGTAPNIPFQNGPIQGHDVFVPMDAIIGGFAMAGQGWRMLVEQLSVGRCISLPSNSTGAAKAAVYASGAYTRIRCFCAISRTVHWPPSCAWSYSRAGSPIFRRATRWEGQSRASS